VLSPGAIPRIKRVLQRERFDLLHLHEPMTPVICTATLTWARVPVVATFHAHGGLGWLRAGKPAWGFLMDRIDRRIAVSPAAQESASRWFPGDYDVIPNGVLIPDRAEPAGRDDRIVFVGRHDPRKGMPVLLRAWPEIHRRTGARLRLVGADPLMVRLAMQRAGTDADGIDALGFLPQEELTEELRSAKALVAPSLGGESFGMVLTRPFACATPVVASDIDGYRQVMTDETGVLVPPGEPEALAAAVVDLLGDEPRRQAMGAAARRVAEERYSWDEIGRRLAALYEELA
jgi:phosphatidylinositol alpha-mannosyltransferase